MYFVKKRKKVIFKLLIFLSLFNTMLFADALYREDTPSLQSNYSSKVGVQEEIKNSIEEERVEVCLHAFDNVSMVVMLVFTSLLGLFFVRDELDEALER